MKPTKETFSQVETSLKSLHFQKAPGRFKKVLWDTIQLQAKHETRVSFAEKILQSLKGNLFPITSGLLATVFVIFAFQSTQHKTSPIESFVNPSQQVSEYIEQSSISLRRVNTLLNLEKAEKKIAIEFIPHAFAENILQLTPELRQQLAVETVRVMKNNTQAIETMSDVNKTEEVIKLLGDIGTLNRNISKDFSEGIAVLYTANYSNNADQTLPNLFNAAINDSQRNIDQLDKTIQSVKKVSKSDQKTISISIRASKKTMLTAQTQLGINSDSTLTETTEPLIETPIAIEEPKTPTKTLKNLCEVETPGCKKSQPRVIQDPVLDPTNPTEETKDPSVNGIEEVFIEKGSDLNGSILKSTK